MSYYAMDSAMYQQLPPATPGWERAPVPGWGTNPLRAGPDRVGVGALGADCGGSCTTHVPWDSALLMNVPGLVSQADTWRGENVQLRADTQTLATRVGVLDGSLSQTQAALQASDARLMSCQSDYKSQTAELDRSRTNTKIAIVGGTVVALVAAWVSHKYWK